MCAIDSEETNDQLTLHALFFFKKALATYYYKHFMYRRLPLIIDMTDLFVVDNYYRT
jgi:hypothetical protein